MPKNRNKDDEKLEDFLASHPRYTAEALTSLAEKDGLTTTTGERLLNLKMEGYRAFYYREEKQIKKAVFEFCNPFFVFRRIYYPAGEELARAGLRAG